MFNLLSCLTDANTGDIRCRFADGTEELAAIGRFLGSYNVPGFQPHFMVGAKDREAKFVKRVITEKHIKNMIESRKFDLGKIDIQVMTGAETTIELRFRPEEPLPISGFPRILTDDDPFICGLPDISFTYSTRLALSFRPNSRHAL
jgi:hypothetical protein